MEKKNIITQILNSKILERENVIEIVLFTLLSLYLLNKLALYLIRILNLLLGLLLGSRIDLWVGLLL